MPKLWLCPSFEFDRVSHYAVATQRSGYVRICLDRVLNISRVPNMPAYWIGKSYTGF